MSKTLNGSRQKQLQRADKDYVPVHPFLCRDRKKVNARGWLTCRVMTVTLESEINWQQTYFEGTFLAAARIKSVWVTGGGHV